MLDDEVGIIEKMERHLGRKKFTVHTANNAKTAYAILEKDPIDITLLDFMIPDDFNGI